MIRSRWLQKLLSVAHSRKDRRRQAARSRKPVRLILESLEERLTPSYDVLKISGASPYAFGAGSIAANQPSGAITVQLQDNNGNAVTATSNRTVVLSSSSSTAQFLDLSGKPLANNSIVIPTGSSSALFEYQDSQTGNAEITGDIRNTSVFGQANIDVEAELVFTTPSRVTEVNQASQPIALQLQDGKGNPITATSNINITLNTSSSTGTFLDTSGNPLANKSITIAAGSNSASFEYEDSSPSQASGVTIGAVQSTSSGELGVQASSAEQQDYIGMVGAIVTPTQTIAPGQPSKPITIQLENPLADDLTINLSSTSSGGTFLDTSGNPLPNNVLVIPHGNTSGSFEYEDSQTGTPFLSATSPALNFFVSVGETVGTSATPVFVSLPQTLATGQPSQPIILQLQSFGSNFAGLTNAVNANSDATIQLSSSSSGGTFLDTSGNPLPNSTLTIKAGTSSASFEYEDSQEGFASLAAKMNSFTSIPQTENVGGVALSFTTAAQTISTGQPSGTITVQVKDGNGNPITSGMTIGLSSNSSTGKFLDTSGNALAGNNITIPAGSSTASFEYEDTVGGTPTLTASIQSGSFASPGSLVSATQQETVNGPYTLTFSTYGVSATPNNPSKPITVSLVSSNGPTATAASDVAVTLSSSSPGGTFLDASGTPLTNNTLTIKAGTSSASFEYEDTQTGIPTLTAAENGFTSQQALPVGVSLAFSTAPQTVAAGQASQVIRVQLQDGKGNAFAAPSNLSVFLSSSLQGVQFLDANGQPLSSSSITLAAGTSTVAFEFNSTWGGTPTLTASVDSSTIPLPSGSLQATQKETVQGLSALVFTTPPQTVAAGQMSQPVTVQLQDNNGNPVNAPSGGLSINMTGYAYGTIGVSPANVKFFDADGNPLPGNSVTVPAGSNSVSFKFETTTAGSAYLQPSVTNGFSAYQNETVQAGPANSVGFLTPAPSLTAGVASGSIVVQLQDKFGNAIQAGSGGVTVTLSSSSTTGQFLSQSGDPLASPSITIPEGASSAIFEYEDSQAGTPTLTATASGVNGTQQLTIAATSASIHVSNTNDSGAGSLRAAIAAANANPGSTIVFDSGVTGTIDLMSDLPYFQTSTNLVGPGANVLTIEPSPNATGSFGGLGIGTPASTFGEFGLSTFSLQSLQPVVTVTGLTVANFKGTGITNYGFATLRQVDVSNNQAPPTSSTTFGSSTAAGGIGNSGTLTVLDSTIANNSTTNNEAAAGINSVGGSLLVINSTIAGNVDNNGDSAGGIAVIDGTASITSSTISGNTASQSSVQGGNSGPGGGIEAEGTVTLYDTLVAGNTGSPANPTDVSGAFTSLGNNLIGVANSQGFGFGSSDLVGTTTNPIDPKLGSLANNGGTTPTMILLSGSPALGAGNSANAPATDQRGDSRPSSGSIDIGSVEITTSSNSGPSITLNPKDQSVVAGQTATFTASASGNPTPTVQWEFSTNGGPFVALTDGTEANGTIVTGSTSPTLKLSNVSASLNGTIYEAIFTNSISSATTSAATLTVTAAATPPNITTQPADRSVAAGDNVSFTAAASGSPTPMVQWQVSSDGGKNFNPLDDGPNVSGSGTPTLALSNVTASMNGNLYEAIFTNSAGNATTNSAMLTVTAPVAPVITGSPSNQTVTAGQTATFTASASGDPTPSVQWQISTNGGASFSPIGGNSTTLTINNVSSSFNDALVEAVFKNSAGSVTTSTATLTVQVQKTPPPPPAPQPPPTLHVPSLLQLFDSLLGGVETINANGTETVTDSFFGFPLLVSTFDSHGNLVSVDLFGSINITFLFTLFA